MRAGLATEQCINPPAPVNPYFNVVLVHQLDEFDHILGSRFEFFFAHCQLHPIQC